MKKVARSPKSTAFVLFLKTLAVAIMVGSPLLGVWVASSLAAFENRATWLPVAAGALLFPGLPLAWDAWASARRSKGAPRFLTFGDRLALRTLAINFVFLGVLFTLFPQRTFLALSARGDWFLDGRSGASAVAAREKLRRLAGGFEWLYRAAHENPYRDNVVVVPDGAAGKPSASPIPTSNAPVASASGATPAPIPTGSASAAASTTKPPSAEPTRSADGALTYPVQETLHPAVAAMPAAAETSIEAVARYLAERESDPFLRVKALHDWVADRIAYNAPSLRLPRIPQSDGDPEAVFRSRIGVCAGYARLLVELGKITKDEIVYVTGDARSSRELMKGEPHAWNGVKIAGRWYLIDATWNAGSVQGDTFTKRYSTEYLFTPPEIFLVRHFPDEPKWQLVDAHIDRTEFFRRPALSPSFFTYGLGMRAPDRSQVSTDRALDVALDNPRNVFVLVSYGLHGSEASTDCAGDAHGRNVRCEFTQPGTYDLNVFVNRERYGTYAHAGSVQVNARP